MIVYVLWLNGRFVGFFSSYEGAKQTISDAPFVFFPSSDFEIVEKYIL